MTAGKMVFIVAAGLAISLLIGTAVTELVVPPEKQLTKLVFAIVASCCVWQFYILVLTLFYQRR